jgi:hypothetical protein
VLSRRGAITATQTGALARLTPDHLVVVDDWDLRKNRVRSRGRALPSSGRPRAAVDEARHRLRHGCSPRQSVRDGKDLDDAGAKVLSVYARALTA